MLDTYKGLLRQFTSVYNLMSVTRDDVLGISAIYEKYGKEVRFFSALRKALSVSRLNENATSVDVNALRLEKYEIIPQAAIGSFSDGVVSRSKANYSDEMDNLGFISQLGPVEVLINSMNDYPELVNQARDDVKTVVDTIMTAVGDDPKLERFAKSNTEKSFVESREVHRKVMQSLVRLNKHKTPAVSVISKTIMRKKDGDSTVLRGICKAAYKAFTEDIVMNQPAQFIPDPDRHRNSKVLLHQLIDAGHLNEGEVVVVADEKYASVGIALIYAGGIRFNGNVYPSPTIAAKYAKRMVVPNSEVPNGWEFWAIKRKDGTVVKMSEILDAYMNQ